MTKERAIELLEDLDDEVFNEDSDGYAHHLAIKMAIDALEERKTGKWIVDALANNIYRCSECGMHAPVDTTGCTEYESNYCPTCGARMEGTDNE